MDNPKRAVNIRQRMDDEIPINNVYVKIIQNGVKLSYEHSFGFYQNPIRKNAYFISDDDLVYPNGKHLICYDMMKKKQTFILKNMEDEKITAMKFNYSRGTNKILIAVALESNAKSYPLVRIYYITKKFSYNLVHQHLDQEVKVIDMAFLLKGGKFLVTLAEVEEDLVYQLSLWDVDHESLLWTEKINIRVTELESCVANNKVFSCAGPRFFKCWNYEPTEKSMNTMPKQTDFIIETLNLVGTKDYVTCHCWCKEDNTLVVSTHYNLFVFKNYEFRHKIDFLFPEHYLSQLIKENIEEIDGEIFQRSKALQFLIELNTPSASVFKDTPVPQMIYDMYAAEYKEVKKKLKHAVVMDGDDKDAAKSLKQLGRMMNYDALKQKLIDREDDILEFFTPIYINLMKEALRFMKIRINCICPQEHGFTIGLDGFGLVCIYKEKKGEYLLESSSKIQNRDVSAIHSLSSSSDNSHIAVVAKIKSKFLNNLNDDLEVKNTLMVGNLEALIFNSSLVNAIKVSYKEPFEFLDEHGPHSGAITSLALCPTKSIIGSLSTDKTLKFWNYTSSDKQMFSFEFHMSQQAFDIHPMSIQCAVGFKQGIGIYFLLENDMEQAYKNFAKPCKAVKYSEGGQYLAVGFVNQIHIVCPYRLITKKILAGHSGSIIHFRWKNRDRYLLSFCSNSTVCIWDAHKDFSQMVEHYFTTKIHKYLSVDYDTELDILVCCCSDSSVKLFYNRGTDLHLNYDTDGAIYTNVLISKKFKVCFFGSEDGSIRIFLWPFIRIGKSKFEYMHIAVHQEQITDMRIGYNNEHLMTCSSDGSIFFLGIKEIFKGKDVSVGDILTSLNEKNSGGEDLGKISNTFNLNEFALLSTKMENTMQEKIKSLDRDIQNTIATIDENNEAITESYNKRIRKIEEENQAVLKKASIQLASQMDERGLKQKKLDLMIKNLEDELKEMVKNKEEHHRRVLLELYSERDMIMAKMKFYEKERDQVIREMIEDFEGILEEFKDDYKKKKDKISTDSKLAMLNLKKDQMMFQEALRQAEEDYNQDLKETVTKLQKEYDKVRANGEHLRSKNSKYEKDIEKNKERSSNLDNLINETRAQNNQLRTEISHFNKKCDEMQDQLNKQERIINTKENMIKEFRNMNYHLQNYKSVYDYQVKTLKEEHEPLSEYVDNLEKHVRTMYNELLSEANSNRALENNISKLDKKIQVTNKQVEKQRKFLMLTKRRLQNLEHDMAILVETQIDDPIFIQKLTKLLQSQMDTILTTENILTKAKNTSVKEIMENKKMHSLEKLSSIELQSIKEDLLRQRDLMSKRLYRRTQRNKVLEKERESVFNSIQEEGKMLINKCNKLRKDGLLLMYKIGLAKKEAEELTNDMKKNFANKNKFAKRTEPSVSHTVGGGPRNGRKKKLLPIEAYRERNGARMTTVGSSVVGGDAKSRLEKVKNKRTLLQYLMKEVDELYNKANQNKSTIEIYQNRIQNFFKVEEDDLVE